MAKKKRVDYICRQLGIKLRTFEPNPYKQELYSEYNLDNITDCGIRALARILNMQYDEAYNKMMEEAMKLHLPSATYAVIFASIIESYGYAIYNYKPLQISIGEFMHKHKKGRYILSYNTHVFAYINGTWYDTDGILKYADIEISKRLCYVFCEPKYTKDL